MRSLPDVLLIGAQRTGTTYLASLLSRHPRVVVSDPKEPAYFTIRWHLGPEWYCSRFNGPEDAVHIDATTWYSVGPTARFPTVRGSVDRPYINVPERIHSIKPEARFIYMLRNPIDRVYSAYWYFVRQCWEDRSFKEAITSDPFYIRSSDYCGQLEKYLKYFPLDRFKFLLHDDLASNPTQVLMDCYEFLGVDLCHSSSAFKAGIDKNPSFRYRTLMQRLSVQLGSPELIERLRHGSHKVWSRGLGRLLDIVILKPVPPISDSDRTLVKELLGDSNAGLEQITGIAATSSW